MSDTITNISTEIEIEFSILSNRLACISSKKNKTKDRKWMRHLYLARSTDTPTTTISYPTKPTNQFMRLARPN